MNSSIFDNSRKPQLNLSDSYFSVTFKILEYEDISFGENIPPIPKLEETFIHYRCPKCFNFPLIEFIDKNEEIIIYTCACYYKKRINIEDLFNKEKKYMTFLEDKPKTSTKNDILGFKCTKHKTLETNNNFGYYCISCRKNLCKDCIQEHLNKGDDIIVFDFQNFETYKKINEILKYENEKEIEEQESISQINSSILEELNNDYSTDKKTNEIIKIKKPDNYIKLKSKKEQEKIHKMFIKFINVIINDYLNYPNYSHFFTIENIHRI